MGDHLSEVDELLKSVGFTIGLVFGVPGDLLFDKSIVLGVDPRDYLLHEGEGPISFDGLEENSKFRGFLWVNCGHA